MILVFEVKFVNGGWVESLIDVTTDVGYSLRRIAQKIDKTAIYRFYNSDCTLIMESTYLKE